MQIPNEWIDFEKLKESPAETAASLVRIDLADIVRTLQTHPELFAFAAMHAEEAKIAEMKASAEVSRVKAQVFLDMASNDPSLPVNRLERMTDTHPDYLKAVQEHVEAAKLSRYLKRLVDSMEQRRDMIVQIHSRQKKELS